MFLPSIPRRKILENCDEYTPGKTPEYFFDKNPENFSAILDIYRTGGSAFSHYLATKILEPMLYQESSILQAPDVL